MLASLSTELPLAFTLAQTNGAAQASAGPSTVVYWIAIALVASGLAIFGVVIATALRGRRHDQLDAVRSYQEAAQAVVPTERVEAPAVPTSPSRAAAPPQASPTTMEAQNLLRLMGEAEELCTRLGRELDEKAERLERLLARAEGRLGAVPNAPSVIVPQPVAVPSVTPQPFPSVQPRPEIVTRPMPVPAPVAASMSPAPAAPSLYYTPSAVPMAPTPPPSTAAAPPRRAVVPAPAPVDGHGVDPLTRDIYALADAGHSPAAIAQQLGQHTGKVELILALRGS